MSTSKHRSSDRLEFAARRVASNFAMLASGEVVSRLLALASVGWLTRSLGAEGFGLLSFGVAAVAYGVLIGRAGLDLWGAREAARSENVTELTGHLIAVRVPLALATFLLTITFAVLQQNDAARPIVLLLALLILVDLANLAWVFLGLEQMRLVALATNLNAVLVTGGALLLVRDGSHVESAALLMVAGELAGATLLLWTFVHRHGWPPIKPDLSCGRSMLVQSLPFAAVAVLGAVRYSFDVVLIGLLLGGVQAGLYSAPYRILTFLISIAAAYLTSLLPALVQSHVSDPARGDRLVNGSIRIMAIFVLPVAVGGTILAEDVVTLLFGPAFERSADAFRVLIWALVPLCLGGGYRILLRASNRQSSEMRAVAWSAGTNVALNLVLIPRAGLVGAATATLVGEMVLCGVSWRLASSQLGVSIRPGAVLRPLVAALVMGGILVLLPARPLVASIAIGTLVYFPVLFLVRGLAWADFRELGMPAPPWST